jgi:hypothetical protein
MLDRCQLIWCELVSNSLVIWLIPLVYRRGQAKYGESSEGRKREGEDKEFIRQFEGTRKG